MDNYLNMGFTRRLLPGVSLRLLLLFILSVGWLVLQPFAVMAQEPDKPSRTGNLVAPDRKPVVISEEALSPITSQTTTVFAPVADAYIASNYPDDNFGGADGLFLGYSQGGLDYGAERILLRFDGLDALPDDITIQEAELRLYLSYSNPDEDTPMDTVLRRLASSWGEDSITWNSEPVWGGVRASPSIGDSPGWYAWDITDLVAGWMQGIYPNYGVEIIGDENAQLRERVFFARETRTDFYPRLIITYTTGSDDTLPPVVTVDPLPGYVARSFLVSWSGSDQGTAGLAYFDVQYRIDGGIWRTWLGEVTYTARTFTGAENGRLYQFRARGVDRTGNVEAWGDVEAQTVVDTLPPSADMAGLPLLTQSSSLTVFWSGSDAESGIQCYDLQYRFENGPWELLQDCTTATSYTLPSTAVPVLTDGRYQFEVRATDLAGNVEPFTNEAEALTIVDNEAPFVDVTHIWLPIVLH